MIKWVIRIVFLILLPFFTSCRTVRVFEKNYFVSFPKEKHEVSLPETLRETSGLEYDNGRLWSFNDSGGDAVLYSFKPDDYVNYKEYLIQGAENIDWEDITLDEKFFYIADVGNNYGTRDTLTIYKVAKSALSSEQKIYPEIIQFVYPEKPPEFSNCSKNPFDCEAIISLGDSLWVFTKDWQNKTSLIYSVGKSPGFYQAELSVQIDPEMLVTGSYFDSKDSMIYLIGYRNFIPSLVIYKLMQDHDMERIARVNYLNRPGLQTEGIIGNHQGQLYFSFEKSRKKQGLMIMKKPEKSVSNPE